MATRERFVVDFVANTRRFMSQVKSLAGRLRGVFSKITAGLAGGGLFGGLLGIGGGIGASAAFDSLSEFAKLASQIKVPVATIQAFDRVAKIFSVDTDKLVEAVVEIRRNIGEGNLDLFRKLGITPARLKQTKDARKQLELVITAAGKLNENDRIATLGKLLGEDLARDLSGIFQSSGPERNQFGARTKEALEFSKVLDRQTKRIQEQRTAITASVQDIRRMRENWVNIAGPIEATVQQLVLNLMPVLQRIIDRMVNWSSVQENVWSFVKLLLMGLVKVLEFSRDINQNWKQIKETIDSVKGFFRGVGGALTSAVGSGRAAGAAAQKLTVKDIKEGFESAQAKAVEVLDQMLESLTGVEKNTRKNLTVFQ